MEKITLKPTDKDGIYKAISANGKEAILETIPSNNDFQWLRAVGGNPKRALEIKDPLFWLSFTEGDESIEVEFERITID